MARWDDAPAGAKAVRAYGSRVGVACFFAGLAFGVVFVVLGAADVTRAIAATLVALAALVNAWRTVRRAPAHPTLPADPRDFGQFELWTVDGERARRGSPAHGSRTFQ